MATYYSNNRGGACFRCKQVGHFARDCVGFSSTPFGGGAPPPGPGRGPGPTVAPPVAHSQPKNGTVEYTWSFSKSQFASEDEQNNEHELKKLFEYLPPGLAQVLHNNYDCQKLNSLSELYLQIGQRAEGIFGDEKGAFHREFLLQNDNDIQVQNYRCQEVDIRLFGPLFGNNTNIPGHRVGIAETLHRISLIIGRDGTTPIGITARVGRTLRGVIQEMLPDHIIKSDKSILLLGRPGVGKTTVLREFARVLSSRSDTIVAVVDKTNEIAGCSNSPHHAIGSARWLPVPNPDKQHRVMREAVENQSPNVLIVDEISTEDEVEAAKTIAQRGVRLIATAHGQTMVDILSDKMRSSLFGGVHAVLLSGQEVARRPDGKKSVLMRKYDPAFQVVIELAERGRWFVHEDVGAAVDNYLRHVPTQAYAATPGQLVSVVAAPAENCFEYSDGLPQTVGPWTKNAGYSGRK